MDKYDKEKVTIKIPKKLYNNLAELNNHTGFSSVTEFITFVLRQIISEKALDKKSLNKEVKSAKEKLKSLGYIE